MPLYLRIRIHGKRCNAILYRSFSLSDLLKKTIYKEEVAAAQIASKIDDFKSTSKIASSQPSTTTVSRPSLIYQKYQSSPPSSSGAPTSSATPLSRLLQQVKSSNASTNLQQDQGKQSHLPPTTSGAPTSSATLSGLLQQVKSANSSTNLHQDQEQHSRLPDKTSASQVPPRLTSILGVTVADSQSTVNRFKVDDDVEVGGRRRTLQDLRKKKNLTESNADAGFSMRDASQKIENDFKQSPSHFRKAALSGISDDVLGVTKGFKTSDLTVDTDDVIDIRTPESLVGERRHEQYQERLAFKQKDYHDKLPPGVELPKKIEARSNISQILVNEATTIHRDSYQQLSVTELKKAMAERIKGAASSSQSLSSLSGKDDKKKKKNETKKTTLVRTIEIPSGGITVRGLAMKLSLKVSDVKRRIRDLGEIEPETDDVLIDVDITELLALEMGIDVTRGKTALEVTLSISFSSFLSLVLALSSLTFKSHTQTPVPSRLMQHL